MLHMAKDEIIVRYRQAKDQNEQVKILAQLNDCPVSEILDILTDEGAIKGIKRKTKVPKNSKIFREEENPPTKAMILPHLAGPSKAARFDDDIIKFYNEGLTQIDIAERLGLDKQFISRRIKKLKEIGEIMGDNKINTRKEVEKLYKEGLSQAEIAKKLNKGASMIKFHLDNIKREQTGNSLNLEKKKEKQIAMSVSYCTLGLIIERIAESISEEGFGASIIINSKNEITISKLSEGGIAVICDLLTEYPNIKAEIAYGGMIVRVMGGENELN